MPLEVVEDLLAERMGDLSVDPDVLDLTDYLIAHLVAGARAGFPNHEEGDAMRLTKRQFEIHAIASWKRVASPKSEKHCAALLSARITLEIRAEVPDNSSCTIGGEPER